MGLSIRKNDMVVVIAGKEKGRKGRVLSVMPSKDQVIIERMNIIKKHMKPSKKYARGGIIEREAPIHRSNIMLVCVKCGKPARISNITFNDGKKARVCKKCKEQINQ